VHDKFSQVLIYLCRSIRQAEHTIRTEDNLINEEQGIERQTSNALVKRDEHDDTEEGPLTPFDVFRYTW